MATKKKVEFPCKGYQEYSCLFKNYFLRCLFHFGSWSSKNVWSTIIIISGKKYTLQYFCFCCRSSCSSGWRVNTSLCSAAARMFAVSGCLCGGRGFTPWVHRWHRNGGPFRGSARCTSDQKAGAGAKGTVRERWRSLHRKSWEGSEAVLRGADLQRWSAVKRWSLPPGEPSFRAQG